MRDVGTPLFLLLCFFFAILSLFNWLKKKLMYSYRKRFVYTKHRWLRDFIHVSIN